MKMRPTSAKNAMGTDQNELRPLCSVVCGLERVGDTRREEPDISRALDSVLINMGMLSVFI